MAHDGETRRFDPRRRPGRGTVAGGDWVLDPALIASALAGIYLLVTGIVALARSDFAGSGLFEPEIVVGGLPHTPLLGLVEIVFGLAVLAGGTLMRDRTAVTFFGVLALVIGLVWLIEPTAFAPYLGVNRANGLQHVIMGLILAGAAQVTPITIQRRSG